MIESSKINESKTARKRKSATAARSGGRAAPTRSPSPEPLAVETPGPPRTSLFSAATKSPRGGFRAPGGAAAAPFGTQRGPRTASPRSRGTAHPREPRPPPAGRHRAPRCRRVCARGFVCPRSAPAHGALGGLRRVGAAARCSPPPPGLCRSAERGGNGGTRAPTAVARPGPAPPERPRAGGSGGPAATPGGATRHCSARPSAAPCEPSGVPQSARAFAAALVAAAPPRRSGAAPTPRSLPLSRADGQKQRGDEQK